MNIKSIFLSYALLAVALASNGQTVDELCKSNVTALGGKSAIGNVKTLKITQVGTSQGTNMPMTTVLMPGKAYYQKIRTSAGSIVTSVKDSHGWTYASMPQPSTTELSVPMAKSMLIQSKFYGPLYDYYVNRDASDVKTISMLKTENIDREKCFNLEVIYKSGYKANIYLSSRDYMIRKVVSPTGTIKYRNYKKAKGVMIPRYVEMTNSNGNITAVVSQVKVNCKIEDDLFTRP